MAVVPHRRALITTTTITATGHRLGQPSPAKTSTIVDMALYNRREAARAATHQAMRQLGADPSTTVAVHPTTHHTVGATEALVPLFISRDVVGRLLVGRGVPRAAALMRRKKR